MHWILGERGRDICQRCFTEGRPTVLKVGHPPPYPQSLTAQTDCPIGRYGKFEVHSTYRRVTCSSILTLSDCLIMNLSWRPSTMIDLVENPATKKVNDNDYHDNLLWLKSILPVRSVLSDSSSKYLRLPVIGSPPLIWKSVKAFGVALGSSSVGGPG